MVSPKQAWLCLLLLTSACTRSLDPCPKGMVGDGDRCVSEESSTKLPSDDAHDASEPLPPDAESMRDAGPTLDAATALDARLDAPETGALVPDSARPADGSLEEAGSEGAVPALQAGPDGSLHDAQTDASTDDADVRDATPNLDAQNDTGNVVVADSGDSAVQVPEQCNDQDLSSWRTFQISGQLIPTLAACFANDPRCARGACDLDGCLREAAGVTGCAGCIAEETRCAVGACAASCAASNTSDECRACACREGCIAGKSGCAMGPVDVCADCNGTTCRNVSLDPALIMVIVNAALYP